jgi:hypothetical protein
MFTAGEVIASSSVGSSASWVWELTQLRPALALRRDYQGLALLNVGVDTLFASPICAG